MDKQNVILSLQHIPKANDTRFITKCYYSLRLKTKGPEVKAEARDYEAEVKILAWRL